MSDITAIKIPADRAQPIERVTFDKDDLKYLQDVVGGYAEAVTLESPVSVVVHSNEDGKSQGLPENIRVIQYLRSPVVIVGDVLVTGSADRHGNMTSVSKAVLDRFRL